MPRFYLDAPLAAGQTLELPAPVVRHVQVRRMQPGQCVTLFNGAGGQWRARIERMGRSSVSVQVLAFEDVEREAPRPVHLGCGLIDASRFDWLVEKACELGAASLTPLRLARSHALGNVARRAERWRSIAA
ncbi:MAG: RsmE family RNA methyltransferase, partial [Ottowia sp.]|nr:RsmE family RNA methyltransferase [Ottowia sp.]